MMETVASMPGLHSCRCLLMTGLGLVACQAQVEAPEDRHRQIELLRMEQIAAGLPITDDPREPPVPGCLLSGVDGGVEVRFGIAGFSRLTLGRLVLTWDGQKASLSGEAIRPELERAGLPSATPRATRGKRRPSEAEPEIAMHEKLTRQVRVGPAAIDPATARALAARLVRAASRQEVGGGDMGFDCNPYAEVRWTCGSGEQTQTTTASYISASCSGNPGPDGPHDPHRPRPYYRAMGLSDRAAEILASYAPGSPTHGGGR